MRPPDLARLKHLTTIIATILVPIILAVAGYAIQARISDQGVQKDYVQMAIGILAKPPSENGEDAQLRGWAVKVLSKSSPVPFGEKLEAGLRAGSVAVIAPFPDELLKSPLMTSPQPWLELQDGATVEDLVGNNIQNRRIAAHNLAKLQGLQAVVRGSNRAMNGLSGLDPADEALMREPLDDFDVDRQVEIYRHILGKEPLPQAPRR